MTPTLALYLGGGTLVALFVLILGLLVLAILARKKGN